MIKLQLKRGTEAVIDAATLGTGEIAFTTDTHKIVVYDGAVKQKYLSIEDLQDNLGGTVGGDGFIKTANSHLTVTYADAGNALTLGVVSNVLYAPVGIELGNVGHTYDITGTTWVTPVAGGTLGFIPDETVANHKLANCLTAIATARDNTYLNVRETADNASAVAPLTVQFLFTGITSFTTIDTRSYYIGSVNHTMSIQLWNNSTGAWDTFATFSGESGYVSRSLVVFNGAPYISTGAVKLQFIHPSNGVTSHQLRFDYIALADGGGGGGGASIASAVSVTPTGGILATNVQTALAELDSEISALGTIDGGFIE